MTDHVLTPSKITAMLDCDHYMTLARMAERGEITPQPPFGPFAELVVAKGEAHERECLEQYRRDGKNVFEVPPRLDGSDGGPRETFEHWVARVGNPMEDGHDVIYQMPFIHDGVRGIADFLVRTTRKGNGSGDDNGGHGGTTDFWYEPVDAKLARSDASVGHILQLCFYAEAIDALTGTMPREVHLWLGSGETVPIRTTQVLPYWRRLKGRLEDLVDAATDSYPVRNAHCQFCEFASNCESRWRSDDSLQLVADFRVSDLDVFAAGGVDTTVALSKRSKQVDGIRPDRLKRLSKQAELQVRARKLPDDAPPPFEEIEPGADPKWGHGFDELPQPDEGDIFLDFEGHPMWTASQGLFFLFGYISLNEPDTAGDPEWGYTALWADNKTEERDQIHRLIEFIQRRRTEHPGMHVYHYNHTERSALEGLTAEHGVAQTVLAKLVNTGCFVDLLRVVKNSVQVGVESYGLKHVERLTGFTRDTDIHGGSGAVVDYDRWMQSGDQALLDQIAAYNEDDVRSTRALRDWLVEQREPGLPWREAAFEGIENPEGYDDQVESLKQFDEGSAEWLLGDVLGYWLRERRATIGPLIARLAGDTDDLYDDQNFVTGLEFVKRVDKLKATKVPDIHMEYPDQAVSPDLKPDSQVIYLSSDGRLVYTSVRDIDSDEQTIDLKWNKSANTADVIPISIATYDWIREKPKNEAVSALAEEFLASSGDPASRPRLAAELLDRKPPRYRAGGGPHKGVHHDVEPDTIARLVGELDESFLTVQGPPGTGKTYTGSHVIASLLRSGLRVGISAFSHNAIDNLLGAIVNVFENEGEPLPPTVRKISEGQQVKPQLTGVEYLKGPAEAADARFQLIGGTAWHFANKKMQANPVDVLVIDEAGQMSLADALSMTGAARNMLLLGDPLQLAQVSKAEHPNGSGASVLEHVLGDHDTIPPDRGVFLHETRRMHPDVTAFISERIYEGRLESHESCSQQTTAEGTGLRWLRATHDGCSIEAPEEAELIHEQITRLVGTTRTDQDGAEQELDPVKDIMVVAPYNAQVRQIEAVLRADPRTAKVRVGTVDRFQGQEAAVVFYSMTASDTSEIHRGSSFLFSPNRLNVAISRARCLAYLVCTEALLDGMAKNVDDLKRMANLCAFVEAAR